MQTRDLVWDGCINVRDLGGHRTEDGRETRFGAIVRADSVRKLSDAGWEALVNHGVRTIVDLRFHSELEADPPLELPVDVVHVPVFPEPSPEWKEIDAIGDAAGPGAPGIRAVYNELLRRRPDGFAQAVSAVGRAREGGVVVHCTAGKDRTGLVSALLLRLAGVPIEGVAEDYAVTTANLRDDTEAWIAAAANEGEREWRRRVSGSPPEAMVGVLTDLGDVAAYLRGGGATDGDLERVRGRLLGEPRMAAA